MIIKAVKTIKNFILNPGYSIKILSNKNVPLRTRLQFIHNLPTIRNNGWNLLYGLNDGYVFKNTNGYVLFSKDTVAFTEDLNRMYSLPPHIERKLLNGGVIDIGAYIGDTILYFLRKGYRKVIAYEPVPENIELIKLNLHLNSITNSSVEINNLAVCEKEGKRIIRSSEPPGTVAFGLDKGNNRPKYELEVECISWEGVLSIAEEKEITVVKIDCEGCEEGLLSVKNSLLAQIPAYFVETHGTSITRSLESHLSRTHKLIEKVEVDPAKGVYILKFIREDRL